MYGQCPLHTCPLTVSTAAVIASGQVGSGGLRLNCTTRPCRACSHASSKASSQPRPISVPSSGCRRPLQRRSSEVAESKAKAYKVNDVTLVNRLHYKGHQRKYICTGIEAMTLFNRTHSDRSGARFKHPPASPTPSQPTTRRVHIRCRGTRPTEHRNAPARTR